MLSPVFKESLIAGIMMQQLQSLVTRMLLIVHRVASVNMNNVCVCVCVYHGACERQPRLERERERREKEGKEELLVK